MLHTASADTKNAAARGNARPLSASSAQGVRQAPPATVVGNQAMLRLQRKCACGGAPGCDCDMGDDKKKKEKNSPTTGLHRAAVSPSAPERVPPIVGETLRTPGQTLDPETQAFFETRFGQDFSGVRIHTDARAAQSARAVNALPYTVDNHIAFAPGRFAPRTKEGQGLLAHELAHTAQQSRQTPAFGHSLQMKIAIGPVNDPLEQEADRGADQVIRMPETDVSISSAAGQFQPTTAASRPLFAHELTHVVQPRALSPSGRFPVLRSSNATPILPRQRRPGKGPILIPSLISKVTTTPRTADHRNGRGISAKTPSLTISRDMRKAAAWFGRNACVRGANAASGRRTCGYDTERPGVSGSCTGLSGWAERRAIARRPAGRQGVRGLQRGVPAGSPVDPGINKEKAA